jgi:hypothetical protein
MTIIKAHSFIFEKRAEPGGCYFKAESSRIVPREEKPKKRNADHRFPSVPVLYNRNPMLEILKSCPNPPRTLSTLHWPKQTKSSLKISGVRSNAQELLSILCQSWIGGWMNQRTIGGGRKNVPPLPGRPLSRQLDEGWLTNRKIGKLASKTRSNLFFDDSKGFLSSV